MVYLIQYELSSWTYEVVAISIGLPTLLTFIITKFKLYSHKCPPPFECETQITKIYIVNQLYSVWTLAYHYGRLLCTRYFEKIVLKGNTILQLMLGVHWTSRSKVLTRLLVRYCNTAILQTTWRYLPISVFVLIIISTNSFVWLQHLNMMRFFFK